MFYKFHFFILCIFINIEIDDKESQKHRFYFLKRKHSSIFLLIFMKIVELAAFSRSGEYIRLREVIPFRDGFPSKFNEWHYRPFRVVDLLFLSLFLADTNKRARVFETRTRHARWEDIWDRRGQK